MRGERSREPDTIWSWEGGQWSFQEGLTSEKRRKRKSHVFTVPGPQFQALRKGPGIPASERRCVRGLNEMRGIKELTNTSFS